MSVEFSKTMSKLKCIFQGWNPSSPSTVMGNILAKSKLFTESIRIIGLNNKRIITTKSQIARLNIHKVVTLKDQQVTIIMQDNNFGQGK